MTAVKLNWDIERSADLSVNICKAVRRIYGVTLPQRTGRDRADERGGGLPAHPPRGRCVPRPRRVDRIGARRHGRPARCTPGRAHPHDVRRPPSRMGWSCSRRCSWRSSGATTSASRREHGRAHPVPRDRLAARARPAQRGSRKPQKPVANRHGADPRRGARGGPGLTLAAIIARTRAQRRLHDWRSHSVVVTTKASVDELLSLVERSAGRIRRHDAEVARQQRRYALALSAMTRRGPQRRARRHGDAQRVRPLLRRGTPR